MAEAPREMLPEDLEFDPTYQRLRLIAACVIGMAINGLRGARGICDQEMTGKDLAAILQPVAEKWGLITFDNLHHAPCCPANHYHRMRMPTGPCTCGARPG